MSTNFFGWPRRKLIFLSEITSLFVLDAILFGMVGKHLCFSVVSSNFPEFVLLKTDIFRFGFYKIWLYPQTSFVSVETQSNLCWHCQNSNYFLLSFRASCRFFNKCWTGWIFSSSTPSKGIKWKSSLEETLNQNQNIDRPTELLSSAACISARCFPFSACHVIEPFHMLFLTTGHVKQ